MPVYACRLVYIRTKHPNRDVSHQLEQYKYLLMHACMQEVYMHMHTERWGPHTKVTYELEILTVCVSICMPACNYVRWHACSRIQRASNRGALITLEQQLYACIYLCCMHTCAHVCMHIVCMCACLYVRVCVRVCGLV